MTRSVAFQETVTIATFEPNQAQLGFYIGQNNTASPAISVCFKINPSSMGKMYIINQDGWVKIGIRKYVDGYGFVGAAAEDDLVWHFFGLCGPPTDLWHSFCFIVDNSLVYK